MKEIILRKLSDAEKKYNVKILYACESGSRAWGFASPDSDYDVRFIYVRPYTEYLRLRPLRDVIEYEVNGVFDIGGWDLKKFLFLLDASNPVLFEWLTSPIVYYEAPVFAACREAFLKAFYPDKSIAHYYSIASKTYKLHIEGREAVRYKKYFYVLRPLLCVQWIKKYGTVPPLEFDILKTEFMQGAELEAVNELLDKKRKHGEKDRLAPDSVLNRLITDGLKENFAVSKEKHTIDADALFLRILREVYFESTEESPL